MQDSEFQQNEQIDWNETYYPDLDPPPCDAWSADEVADWIERLGFPQYRECFIRNFITGRKLILLEASHFPLMNITDFSHIMTITAAIRRLLGTKLISFDRHISLPRREPWALFLEQRCQTGTERDELRYPLFLKKYGLRHTDP